jgi:hypothetical protein
MVEIQDKIVSLDIFTEFFCCDLEKCHGICCVEGDAGAPVRMDEIGEIEESCETVWEELDRKAQKVIKEQGVVYPDRDGEMVTSIVNGKDCVFTTYKDGCCFCALEQAYRQGKTKFCKPISCALYPIRLSKIGDYTAVNYHKWGVCKDAIKLGKKLNMPIYKFLKQPLIRAFGEDWYKELEITAEELKKHGYI